MFAPLKKYIEDQKVKIEKREAEIKQQEQLAKVKKFYQYVQAGAAFSKFIQEDLKRQENGMDRHVRRRFQKELEHKGVFSPELLDFYQQKVDWILSEIAKREAANKLPKGVQTGPDVRVQKEKPTDVA